MNQVKRQYLVATHAMVMAVRELLAARELNQPVRDRWEAVQEAAAKQLLAEKELRRQLIGATKKPGQP